MKYLLLAFVVTGCAKPAPTPEALFKKNHQNQNIQNPSWNSMHMVATATYPNGISGTWNTWVVRGKGKLDVIELSGIGKQVIAYDLENAWELNPLNGPKLKEGAEAESLASMYLRNLNEGDLSKQFTDPEFVGETTFRDIPVYEIKAKPVNLEHTSVLYLSKKDATLVGNIEKLILEQGELEVTAYYSEYGTFNGINMPIKIEQTIPGIQLFIEVQSVTFDGESVPEIKPTPEIQSLIDEKNGVIKEPLPTEGDKVGEPPTDVPPPQ